MSDATDGLEQIPFELVQTVVSLLEPLSRDQQRHVLDTVTLWLRLDDTGSRVRSPANPISPVLPNEGAGREEYRFSGRPEAGPKEFLLEKQPNTDVERLACLAYYLTHFREQQYFKTEDLSKLNTEAAQRGFSNPSLSAKNAYRDGFFVAAPKQGMRQLSALGEQYVQALPNHVAARDLRKRMFKKRAGRPRRIPRKQTKSAE